MIKNDLKFLLYNFLEIKENILENREICVLKKYRREIYFELDDSIKKSLSHIEQAFYNLDDYEREIFKLKFIAKKTDAESILELYCTDSTFQRQKNRIYNKILLFLDV